MNPIQQINTLFNAESISKPVQAALQPGQLVYGRVEKFLPGQKAVVQIGGAKFIAELKAPLSIGKGYWFETISDGDGGIQLKAETGTGKEDIRPLLAELQLPDTKNTRQLLDYFSAKSLPFTKEQLVKAEAWMKNSPDLAKNLTALGFMLEKNLPFTIKTFEALLALQDPSSLTSQLEETARYLEDAKFMPFPSVPPLRQMLASLLEQKSLNQTGSGERMKELIKLKIREFGLEFENEVRLNEPDTFKSLKPLLLAALGELGEEGKRLEPVLNRITGMQLISQDVTGPMQQMVMQLPFFNGNRNTDTIIQWSGRKARNGRLDPDYCRIIFYLELKSLDLTVIDMQVQNRVVHLSIENNARDLQPIVAALSPMLKQKLESLNYSLSFIKVIPSSTDVRKENSGLDTTQLLKEYYQGVDFKI